MKSKEFREELVKIMPGYAWTVHKPISSTSTTLVATGTQSSGSNRLSTLDVTRRERDDCVTYTARSAGYGLRAKWLHTQTSGTLARSLRHLQEHYEHTQAAYGSHAKAMQRGRKAETKEGGAV